MSDSRKQPSVVWLCVALVFAMPVAYFASLGPVSGILSRLDENTSDWLVVMCDYYAVPANIVYDRSPEIVQNALEGYVEWFE